MDYTLNIVNKWRLLCLNICGLRKGPGKFFMGSLESFRFFFVCKRSGAVRWQMIVEPLLVVARDSSARQAEEGGDVADNTEDA